MFRLGSSDRCYSTIPRHPYVRPEPFHDVQNSDDMMLNPYTVLVAREYRDVEYSVGLLVVEVVPQPFHSRGCFKQSTQSIEIVVLTYLVIHTLLKLPGIDVVLGCKISKFGVPVAMCSVDKRFCFLS